MQKENELIVGDISESSRNNSSNPSQEEIQLSYIQQNRRMFQRSGAINIQTPSRNSNSGVAVRQSRFCKTQVYSSEQSQEQLLQILNAKKSQREKILEQNTPLSSKNGRRGSLNIYSKLEALGQKNQTLTKLKTQSDLDSNDEEENFEEKVSKYTLYEIAKQSSIQELDEDTFQKNQHSVFAVPSHQQFIQDQNLEVPEEDSSDEDANDQEQQLNNSKVNNLPPPSQLKSNYHQRVKSMMSGTQEKTKYSPQRNSLQDALQNIIQKHEARPMKSRNLSQVSPLQKQIFQQKIMSINNFNMPSLSPECSPINGYDDLVDDHNETQFSLQSMQRTELEIAELDQLNQIKENIQLKQKMSHQHECQMDRRNAHENENLNKSHEIIGERRGNQKRTTFRSLSNRRIVKESTLIHKSKINGQKTMNQYEIGSVLGEGQYGKVRYAKVKDENGSFQEFAIKYFKKQQLKKMKQFYKDEKGRTKIFTGIQTVQSEIAVMKKLEHENIVKLYEVIDDTENDKIYLVIDFAEKGQLIEYDERKQLFLLEKKHQDKGTIEGEIEYFAQSQTEYKNSDCSIMSSEEQTKEPILQVVKEKVFFIEEYLLRKIFRDCLKGLGYLHFNDVIHRDLKPQNILFTQNGTAVITDFSISLILGEQKVLKQDQGTLCFMAPELIDNEKNVEKNNDFYKRADIWSLGVTFFCFVFYTTPYKSTNLEDLFNEISTTDLQFPKTRSISFGLKLILKSMLNSHPLERITLDELIDDEWVNDGYSSLLRDEIELQEKVVISQQDIKQAMVPKNEVAFIVNQLLLQQDIFQ